MGVVKAVVAAFNQEKALVGAFSVITNLRMDLFEALASAAQFSAHFHWSECRHASRGYTGASHRHPASVTQRNIYTQKIFVRYW